MRDFLRLIQALGLITLVPALYVVLNVWMVSLLIKHADAIRAWIDPKLDFAENYARSALPSHGRLTILWLIFSCSFISSVRLRDETETLMFPLWWCIAVFGYTSCVLLCVPERWWGTIKEWQSRAGYLSALVIAAIIWLSTGMASNEVNAMFEVPATMLPFALTSYSFAIATFFVAAAITMLILIPLTIFYVFGFISGFSTTQKNSALIKRGLTFAAIYSLGQTLLVTSFQPISAGYARPVVERIALEFDFDEKVLCKNLTDSAKYLLLDSNRNFVLRIAPVAEWDMTPAEMAQAKKRGELISAIHEKSVVKCEL